MSLNSLDIQIYQLANGDLYFNTSSDNATLYKNKCATSVAEGGDYFLVSPSLINFTDYSMFNINDYSLLQTGSIDNSDSVNNTFKIRIALNQGTFQPTSFILRIFNGSLKFTDSFKLKGGNTGIYFDNANTFFILSENFNFTSILTSIQPVSSSNLYRNLFYILLVLFILMTFRVINKFKT